MAEFHSENNKKVFEQLIAKHPECTDFWRTFLSLTEIPRPSEHTAKATEWAIEAGKKLGGHVKSDKLGNVAISFPGTAGKEHLPAIVLQAHLDMVGTKADDLNHNFITDPIHVYIDGQWLKATKTTLGGDDGSGVAACLAIAGDKKLAHAPIEVLFTVDEEIGLVGATKMAEGELLSKNAKYLINVDSEDWGEICVSCAGSVNRTIRVPTKMAPQTAGWSHISMKLKDFKGGHTGVHIQLGRANALKWAQTILCENKAALEGVEFRLTSFTGGNAHNAVPVLALVEFSVPSNKALYFIEEAKKVFAALVERFAHVEVAPAMEISLLAQPSKPEALTFASTRTVLRFLESVHHGVWTWSEECPTLVETSQSVSKAGIDEKGHFWIEVFARSSQNTALTHMAKLLEDYATLYGGVCEQRMDDMPGWPAEPHSRLCVAAQRVFAQEFKKEAKVVPIHAGLECGIIINKFPANKMEAVSVGPTVLNPHTINEQMDIQTCVQLYHYLTKLVEDLSQ